METSFSQFFKNRAKSLLVEMPQHYKGNISYQKDSKFLPISKNNVSSYTLIGEDGQFAYTVHPELSAGFVFDKSDLQNNAVHDILPVLRLSLREFPYKGYKQAHALRIRSAYSRQNIATAWYLFYADAFGGVVSDHEHLEGGKTLWRSLINQANARGFKTSLVNIQNQTNIPIDKNTPDNEIWSNDPSRKNDVIVLEKL